LQTTSDPHNMTGPGVYTRKDQIFYRVIGIASIVVALVMFLLIGISGMLPTFMGLLILPYIIFFLLAGIFLVARAIRTRLALSAEGIAYHTVWYQVRTTWDNIERIGTVGQREALLLRQPVPVQGHGWLALFVRHTISAIPPAAFGQTTGDDPLAQDLKRYLPHLFAPTDRG
jgi:hypothetical protein